jgi:hypothetical protein
MAVNGRGAKERRLGFDPVSLPDPQGCDAETPWILYNIERNPQFDRPYESGSYTFPLDGQVKAVACCRPLTLFDGPRMKSFQLEEL